MSIQSANLTLALIAKLEVSRLDALSTFDFKHAGFCAAKIEALNLRLLTE